MKLTKAQKRIAKRLDNEKVICWGDIKEQEIKMLDNLIRAGYAKREGLTNYAKNRRTPLAQLTELERDLIEKVAVTLLYAKSSTPAHSDISVATRLQKKGFLTIENRKNEILYHPTRKATECFRID